MLGAVIGAAVCVTAGVGAARRLVARAGRLRAWQRALTAMGAACAYARADCAQILRAGSGDMPCLLVLARGVETRGEDPERAFRAQGRDSLLRPEEETVLSAVFRAAARGGREEISAAVAYAQERFAAFCAEADRKRQADARMYVTLGVLSGLCVFLIAG